MAKRKQQRGVSGNPARRAETASDPVHGGRRTAIERAWRRTFKGVRTVREARTVSDAARGEQ